jgi:hypothetical protein
MYFKLALFVSIALLCDISHSFGVRPLSACRYSANSLSALSMGNRQRAWAKGDLNDKDIFEAEDSGEVDNTVKNKLAPEITFFEGPPDASEMFFPTLSILTVIGIIPFMSSLARQLWVRYKFTSRRINIVSGIGGNDESVIIYPDIEEVRFVFRAFGKSGDMVLFLKDGAKVELRHVSNFVNVLKYVLDQCDDECREKSQNIPATFLKDLDPELVAST